MKYLRALLITVSCYALVIAGYAKTDGIAAVVNEDIITYSELHQHMRQVKRQQTSAISRQALAKQTLQQLIDTKLELQTAQRLGITADDARVNKAIQDIAKRNRVSVAGLYEHVATEGMSRKQYRENIRQQIIIAELIQQTVAREVKLSAEDIAHARSQLLAQQHGNTQYHVINYIYAFDKNAPQNTVIIARDSLIKLRNALKKGQDFYTLQDQYPHIERHDLGWRRREELPAIYLRHLTSMSLGEFSKPIRTPNGEQLIQLMAKREDVHHQSLTAKQQQQRARNLAYHNKLEQARQKWLSKLRDSAYIKINRS
ncbi:MAG: SurA N-terminal domain-containing protein [Gammaproteobacteria bacterium]